MFGQFPGTGPNGTIRGKCLPHCETDRSESLWPPGGDIFPRDRSRNMKSKKNKISGRLGVVFLFPTDTFASRFGFTPQMKALCSVWGSEASIHHLSRTQVQRKCLPLSRVQTCHAVPLPLLFPGDLIEKVKFSLGQTICSCRGAW